jgi:DNA-binding response OmpR family regulator
MLRVGSLTVDCDARVAQVDDRRVNLSRLEFDLLQTLASQPHKAFTRAELTRQVWGYDPAAAGPSRTVDTHAARLRQKLEQAGAEPLVQNVRGVGWRLTR